MSRIAPPDIGVVGVRHWEPMASAMIECLDQIIGGRETKIPIGVLCDALLFFKIVLERKTGTHFDNSLARINAHLIAWGSFERLCRSPIQHFLRYSW